MVKNLAKSAFLVFILFVCNSALAKTQIARSASSAFEDGTFVPLTHGISSEIYKFDESSFIYFANISGKEGAYLFNADSGTSELLIQVPFSYQYAFKPKFTSDGNRILIDYLGKLLITDGTPSGTHLLAEFNPFLVGGSAGILASPIGFTAQMDGDLFFTTTDSNGFTELWRVDDHAIQKLAVPSNLIKGVFKRPSDKSGEVSVLVKTHGNTDSIWRVSTSKPPTFITAFTSNGDFNPYANASTNNGVFFCEPTKGVWMLNNSGKLNKISNGCDYVFHKVGETLFFLDNEKLFRTNGNIGSKSTVFNFSNRRTRFINANCEIDGTVYFLAQDLDNEVKLWSVNNANSTSQEVYSFGKMSVIDMYTTPIQISPSSCDDSTHSILLEKYIAESSTVKTVSFHLAKKKPFKILNTEKWSRLESENGLDFINDHFVNLKGKFFLTSSNRESKKIHILKIDAANIEAITGVFSLLLNDE